MRICILSNSHAAALQGNLEQVGTESGCAFTVFATPTTGMQTLLVDEERRYLYTDAGKVKDYFRATSGGLEAVNVAQYDAFLVHGLFMTPPRFDQRHSSAFRAATCRAVLEKSEGQRVAHMLRTLTTAPICLSPEPLKADFEDDDTTLVRPTTNAPANPVDPAVIWTGLEQACTVGGSRWIFQDAATIGTRLNTKRHFASGAARLNVDGDKTHKVKNISHMNAAYGEAVLRTAVPALQS